MPCNACYQELAQRQKDGVNHPKAQTVIGTTNPFFMKVRPVNADA
jgi:hypothetical protein